jgi:preprotein translocase subunit SecA
LVFNDNQKEEDYILMHAGKPGVVTITTNAAGLRTNITMNEVMLVVDELHAIIDCLPANLRIEVQAMGCTARQGQK